MMYKTSVSIKSLVIASALLLFGGINPALAAGGANNAAAMDFAKACSKEIDSISKNDAVRNALNNKYNTMRSGCAEFRQCKRSCRKQKQDCKGGAKVDKIQCISACKSIDNKKERKACKKACRSDKKVGKIDCKQSKRSCKEQCRGAMLKTSCKSSRNNFWGEVAKTTEQGLRACMKEFPKN